jgi:hypothetical protein
VIIEGADHSRGTDPLIDAAHAVRSACAELAAYHRRRRVVIELAACAAVLLVMAVLGWWVAVLPGVGLAMVALWMTCPHKIAKARQCDLERACERAQDRYVFVRSQGGRRDDPTAPGRPVEQKVDDDG